MHCTMQYSSMYSRVQLVIMKIHNGSKGTVPTARRGGSRGAIVDAAERLFLKRGFGSVSMDELAVAAGVARRTLYNQFSSKEEIFREMLLRLSSQLEDAFPAGIETQGDVEHVLRRIARTILELHEHPEYLGFLRMVVADSRQFPWIAKEFATVMDPQTERIERYLAHLTALGILDCRNPMLATHQFIGMLNELSLWPWMMDRESLPVSAEDAVEETIRMFLQHYRRPQLERHGDAASSPLRQNI
jgi:TetR/AcrR family transcriptional regulator, regulator of autoinduction and epiphytic fitness